METITVWGDPNELMKSQFGQLTYGQWCRLERDRINNLGGKVNIQRRRRMIALVNCRRRR